jgi:putative ABC transport system permease protein
VVVGSLFALASSRILEATLYGIAAFDPSLLFWLSMFVAVTGLAAAYVPARRALAIEPAVALRHE